MTQRCHIYWIYYTVSANCLLLLQSVAMQTGGGPSLLMSGEACQLCLLQEYCM